MAGVERVRGPVVALLLGWLACAPPVASATPGEGGLRLYGMDARQLGYAPQLRTDVAIRIAGAIARVRVQQRFHNPGDAWVEGVYVFPLPEAAAVDRLRMVYAERLIEGEIRDRQDARRRYAEARHSGRGASLVEQQRRNLFTASVANIPPHDTVLVEIEYQQSLQWRDDAFGLRFPMVVAPRYIPGRPLAADTAPASGGSGWSPPTDAVPDAPRVTPPVLAGAGPGFNPVAIGIELDTGFAGASVHSPSHRVDVEDLGQGRYRVVPDPDTLVADRDFVLRWAPPAGAEPRAALFTEYWRGRHYNLLMVMPPQAASLPGDRGRELILVVDTSGSMHGESIAQARAALMQALQLLRPGDRFNVIEFNNRPRRLFARARPADARHLERARRYVDGLRAQGGTEMQAALAMALDDRSDTDLLRQVVFLTDGAVGNEQQLFETIGRRLGRSRLFTVGIGAAPNSLFMAHAARAGRGTFTYIADTGEVGQVMTDLFDRLSRPALSDIRLAWDFGTAAAPPAVRQAPAAVPDLYAGEPLVVALQSADRVHRVRISGRFGRRPWQHAVALRGGAPSAGLHALWARRVIDDWLARPALGDDLETVRAAVVQLAMEHRLVSRWTSLVAVDRTPSRPPDAAPRTAAVPARLPAGWSGDAVFGRLPTTATPAALYALAGLACIALALAWRGLRP